MPPTAIARTPDDAVATFDRPMYRPDDAFGMMSVMSAQSTARKIPVDRPKITVPTSASGKDGATATMRQADRTDGAARRR